MKHIKLIFELLPWGVYSEFWRGLLLSTRTLINSKGALADAWFRESCAMKHHGENHHRENHVKLPWHQHIQLSSHLRRPCGKSCGRWLIGGYLHTPIKLSDLGVQHYANVIRIRYDVNAVWRVRNSGKVVVKQFRWLSVSNVICAEILSWSQYQDHPPHFPDFGKVVGGQRQVESFF